MFKKITIISTIIFSILFLNTCTVDKTATIKFKGKITLENGEFAANADIYLYVHGDVLHLITNGTTNENGEYFLEKTIEKKNHYGSFILIAIHDGIKTSKSNPYEVAANSTYNKTTTINLTIPQKHILKVQLINLTKSTEFGGIKFVDYQNENEYKFAVATEGLIQTHYGQTFYGSDVDTTFYVPIDAALAKEISYQLLYWDGTPKNGNHFKLSPSSYNLDTLYQKFEY